jgi:hypothetical protein
MSLSVSPTSAFLGTGVIGSVLTSPPTFTITATATNDMVNSIVIDESEFFVVTGVTLPYTFGAPGTITFQVYCVPEFLGLISYPTAITINTSSGALILPLSYTGQNLTSAFPLTGAAQGVLCGFFGTAALGTVAQMLASTNCEVSATWIKQHDFGTPSEYTYVNRVFVRIENGGTVTATLTDTAIISGVVTTTSDTKTVVALTTDQSLVQWLWFDLENNGESHLFQMTVAANGGNANNFNIDLFVFCYDPRGSVYESS